MGRGDSGWFGESRRHALSQKGIETRARGKPIKYLEEIIIFDGKERTRGSVLNELEEQAKRQGHPNPRRSAEMWMIGHERHIASGLTDSQIEKRLKGLEAEQDRLDYEMVEIHNEIAKGDLTNIQKQNKLNKLNFLLGRSESIRKEENNLKIGIASGRIKTDQGAIDFLSQKPLSDLRRRQSIVNDMIKIASERRMSESLAKLQIREWHLQQAILKKTFPEDYEFGHPNHILELKKILGIKKDELGDLD